MKVIVVWVLVPLAAGVAVAVGSVAVTTNMTAAAVQVAGHAGGPAALLVSGTLLLGLAGAVKRFTL